MDNKWLWKIILIPATALFLFGVIGLIYPYGYMDFYLKRAADSTWHSVYQSHQDIAVLLELIFRAEGLAMVMSGILAVFIIIFSFRKGEKWSIPALIICGTIGIIGEIILEIMILK